MVKVYFQKNNEYRVYNTETFQFTTESFEEIDYKGYFMFKDYEPTDKGLLKYATDFVQECNELKSNEVFKLDYIKKFKNHYQAVIIVGKMLLKDVSEFEETSMIEYSYMEKCNNGSLQKLNCSKGTTTESYAYDFTSQWPYMLGNHEFRLLEMPTKQGKEYKLKELDCTNLKVGYYNVKISSKDERFNNTFAYSVDNMYTNVTIYQVYQHQMDGVNIKMELQQDKEYNCYLYGKGVKDGIKTPSKVFGHWYNVLSKLKKAFPKNKLIKHLMSAYFGHAIEFNTKSVTFDEIKEQKLSVTMDCNNQNADYLIQNIAMSKKKGGLEYYELVNIKKPYKIPQIARLKPFLMSCSRRITSKIAWLYIDDLVRIHTDCIVFNKEHDDVIDYFKYYPKLKKEDKTTGKIQWMSVSSYKNFTNGYTTKNYN